MKLFSNNPMTPVERKEAILLVERGRFAKEFIEGQFWIKFLGPYLREQNDSSAHSCLFNPKKHKATIESIALQLSFNSGMAEQINMIREELSIWITKGEDARAELDKDNKLIAEIGDRK